MAKLDTRRRRGRRVAAGWSFAAAGAVGLAAWLRARRGGGSSERRSSMADAKQIARRILEEAFNEGRLEVADELMAEDSIGHDPALPQPVLGPAAFKELVGGYRAAFPDLYITVEDQCAERDTVCTRWTAQGTHEGELWGIAPTGRQSTVTGITIDRIKDGRIAESWTNWDTLGLLQQIGAVSAPAQAST